MPSVCTSITKFTRINQKVDTDTLCLPRLLSIFQKRKKQRHRNNGTASAAASSASSELCSKKMDQKRMMSAQLKLKAVMHSAEQGETKEDDQPVAKILNQPGGQELHKLVAPTADEYLPF